MSKSGQIKEEELYHLLSAKDPAGMEILYDHYAGIIYGIVLRIVRDDAVAEEAFLSVMQKLRDDTVVQPGEMLVWITGTARQVAMQRLRTTGASTTSRDNISPMTVNYNPDTEGWKRKAGQLEAEHRNLVDLAYFNGLTQIELALKLHVSLGAVKARARAAGLRLQEIFESDGH